MKKTYNVPATIVVAFKAQKMLASSPTPNVTISNDNSNSVAAENVETRQHQGVGGGLWSDMQ